jgi:predicted nucleotidyltransferase
MADINNKEIASRIARRFAEFLKQYYHIHSVYLYGSYAKGINHEDSDIDIAVVAEDFTGDLVEDIFKLMKLRRQVHYKIEPHPFLLEDFNKTNPLAREIIETGIRIM